MRALKKPCKGKKDCHQDEQHGMCDTLSCLKDSSKLRGTVEIIDKFEYRAKSDPLQEIREAEKTCRCEDPGQIQASNIQKDLCSNSLGSRILFLFNFGSKSRFHSVRAR